jgi:hypothetical protein
MFTSTITDSRLDRFATVQSFEFDGTSYTIGAGIYSEDFLGNAEVVALRVTVTEGELEYAFWTVDGSDLHSSASWYLSGNHGLSQWTRDRITYVFSLAGRKIAQA